MGVEGEGGVMLIPLMILIGSASCIAGVIVLFIAWSVNYSQTRDYCELCAWGSYKSFRKEFDKRTWVSEGRGDGWWCRYDRSEIFAGVISFQGKGMLLSPSEFVKVKWFLRQQRPTSTFKWEE